MNTPNTQHHPGRNDDTPPQPIEARLDELGSSLRHAMPEGLAERTAQRATRVSRERRRPRPTASRSPRRILAIAGPLAVAATFAIAAVLWQGPPALTPQTGSTDIAQHDTQNDPQARHAADLAAAAAELESWLLTIDAAEPSEVAATTDAEQIQPFWSTDPILTGEVSF